MSAAPVYKTVRECSHCSIETGASGRFVNLVLCDDHREAGR